MANSKELKALIVLAGKIDPSLQTAMLKASNETLRVSNRAKEASKHMGSLGDIIKGTFIGNLAADAVQELAYKVKDLAGEGIKLASDLVEVQNVVDVTFGKNANQIDDWAKTALKSFGLSELAAKQYSSTMGAMLKSSGITDDALAKMSENLTALGGDISSFYNIDKELAFEKIRSGLAGETEPLRQLGINMTVANLEAYALSKGIKTSYDKMNQASQVILRYNYLLDHSKDAQGDFARTQGSFANQQRLFNTNMQRLAATIGEKALPYLTQWLQTANNWATNADVGAATQTVVNLFDDLGDAIKWASDNSDWLIPVIGGVAASFGALQIINGIVGIYNTLTAAQIALNIAMDANPIGLIVLGIGGLVAAGIALWKNWDWIVSKAQELWAWLGKVVEPVKEFLGLGDSPRAKEVQTASIMYAQGYASGGIAYQPSIFGEDGPEMAIPLERTPRSMSLLARTAKILGVVNGSSTSSQATSGSNGSPLQVIFAPVIQGGGGPEVTRALDSAFEQFKAWADQYFEDKVRVAYGQ